MPCLQSEIAQMRSWSLMHNFVTVSERLHATQLSERP